MKESKIVRVVVRIAESVIDIVKGEYMNDKPNKKRRERTKGKNEDKGRKDKKGSDGTGRNSAGSDAGSNL